MNERKPNGFFTEEAFERIVDRDFEEENDEEEDRPIDVLPDMDMWNEWLNMLCKGTGAESAEDLSLTAIEEELSVIRVVLTDEENWSVPRDEILIATLREYIKVLEELSEMAKG